MLRPGVAFRLAAAALLSLSACTFDDSVQGLPRVRCETDAQCPASMTCRLSVNRCLPKNPPETVPPFIEERLVFPDIGSFGQRFSFGLRASEILLEPPRVHVVASDGRELSPVVPDDTVLPEREYRFFYDAPASLEPGVPEGLSRVVVDLVDAVGNSAERLEVGSFTLDFTPPSVIAGGVADVSLSPGTGNPLAVVNALTEGSTARISFVASEPLLDAQLSSNVPGLSLVRTGGEGTSYVFTGFLADAGQLDAEVTLSLVATDRAGNPIKNPTLSARPPLRVDTIAPGAPATGVPREVVYTRAPLGELNGRGPYFEVVGDAGSAEPGSRVFVREPGSDGVVAQVLATDGGAFGPLSLGTADRGLVFVSAVDGAGNESPRVPVNDVSYVASLRGKVLGSTLENPHRLELRPSLGPAIDQAGTEIDGLPSSITGTGTWKQRALAATGPAECAAIATDLRRGRAMTWPYFAAGSPWEWDGEDWKPFVPQDPELDGNPAIQPSVIGFDEARGRLVLVTNYIGGTPTWESDGVGWKAMGAPTYGTNIALPFWPTIGRLVSVDQGGYVSSWSGAAWTTLATGAAGLFPIVTAAADRSGGALIAVNGARETWAYDGGWQRLGADAGLSLVFGFPAAKLVDNPVTGGLWLVEQSDVNQVRVRSWNGVDAGWSGPVELDAVVSVTGCPWPAFYDPVQRTLVLHDAQGRGTWALLADGGFLALQKPDPTLANGLGARGAFAPAYGGVAMVVPQAQDRSDFLLYDGHTYGRLPAPPPGQLAFAGVLEDPTTGGLLVHGGKLFDGGTSGTTWQFNPSTGWQDLDAGGPALAAFAWARSNSHGGVVLHGGTQGKTFTDPASSATWLLPFDGGTWRQLGDAGVDPAAFHQMSCDAPGPGCQLMPGSHINISYNKLWHTPASDGGLWELTTSYLGSNTPAAGYALARDPALPYPFVFGGRIATTGFTIPSTPTWLLYPQFLQQFYSLTDLERDGSPPPRSHPVLVHDRQRNVTVMIGGAELDAGLAALDQPWELHYSDLRPGSVFTVDLARAEVRPDAIAVGLRLDVQGVGVGKLRDGGTVNGVEVLVAGGGQWLSVGQLGPDAGALTLTDPRLLNLVLRGQRTVRAAVAPLGNNAASPASLTLQRLDVTVDYRLP